jgi:cytoskeletal protein RodZ
MVKPESPWWAHELKEALKGYGLAVCIVLWMLGFLWWYAGGWVQAKAEAERTQARTTADLSAVMRLLSEAQDRNDKRTSELEMKNAQFQQDVRNEHTEAAKVMQNLLMIMTELVQEIKNGHAPLTPGVGGGSKS